MMTSTHLDLKYIALQNRCKGGKLPLKKRRFSLISETDLSVSLQADKHVTSYTATTGLEALSIAAASKAAPEARKKKTGSMKDKRYTGVDGEVRCLATTTRGKACAYIAVCGSKYCTVHADYDTNPPPKRGSSKKANKEEGIDRHNTASPASPKPSAATSGIRRNGSKVAKKHLDSKFPLLSMISTDQWAKRRVKITVGPFADSEATVVSQSNGWVSVRVDGVGLHNRRSFELVLVPDSSEESTAAGISRVTPSPSSADDSSSVSSSAVAVKLAVKAPITPIPVRNVASDWPVTPAISQAKAPFIPKITPTTPHKALATTKNASNLHQKLLLSEPGDEKGRGKIPLQKRSRLSEGN